MNDFRMKIPVFLLSFIIGFACVWFMNSYYTNQKTNKSAKLPEISEINPVEKHSEGIEIKFKQFVEIYDSMAADFEITNTGDQTYFYSGIENEETVNVWLTEEKLDGKKVEQWKCGNGTIEYVLKPGETKIFRYNLSMLSLTWKDNKNFQIGFYFRKKTVNGKTEFSTSWSEEVPISDSVREKLLD